ncbi:MAG TPA: M90 family metallopeptidase [Gammaproteobacteria bacterium]|nr:M90 family metallopeptidase [Gammaproteobacteria bacterium]
MLKNWRRRRVLARHSIPDELWSATVADIPAIRRLGAEDRRRLRDLVLLFLHEKHFEPVQGLVLDDARRLRIAALACLPILALGLDAYSGFHSIVVHPDEFLVRDRTYEDEDGVVHVGDDLLSGEAFEQGPVVLAWSEIEASGRGEGYNVVVHELAHKLDMLTGEANGVPPLHADMRMPEWVAAFDAAYDDLCEQLERGVEPWIDPYAVEDAAEFFAVCAELFFDMPKELRDEYPDVYLQLAKFFRQDPAAA